MGFSRRLLVLLTPEPYIPTKCAIAISNIYNDDAKTSEEENFTEIILILDKN